MVRQKPCRIRSDTEHSSQTGTTTSLRRSRNAWSAQCPKEERRCLYRVWYVTFYGYVIAYARGSGCMRMRVDTGCLHRFPAAVVRRRRLRARRSPRDVPLRPRCARRRRVLPVAGPPPRHLVERAARCMAVSYGSVLPIGASCTIKEESASFKSGLIWATRLRSSAAGMRTFARLCASGTCTCGTRSSLYGCSATTVTDWRRADDGC